MERIQDRLQEKQALTHYDDLGLPASASDEEVREAYLNLVRLLHPDTQRDPTLKRFAENQLKRVSRAYAVLSDPERRRRYDSTLTGDGVEATPAPPMDSKRSVGRWRARALITIGWLICAFAGVVGIGWYFSQPPGERAETAKASAATTSPVIPTRVAAPPSNPATPASDVADKDPDVDALRAELSAVKTARDRALDQTVLQAKELDFLTRRILNAPHGPLFGPSRFSGVWILPPSRTAASAFTPESVDLIMTERQGALEGRYRARYPSMGVPEPPMVRFYFEGKCQDDMANAAWTGDDGSKGEIQFKLTSGNTLQLVWSVTDPGNQTGPASGTLALVRKHEPL